MADIRHMIEVTAPPSAVYPAMATRIGVEGWWTPHVTVVSGSADGSKVGDVLQMHFDRIGSKQELTVVELVPGQRVRWRCGEGSFDGTEIAFELRSARVGTALSFAHTGWKSATAYFAQCNFNWGFFMQSLKRLIETGEGTPR